MPTGSDKKNEKDNLVRALIYGVPKTKKTWWASNAAEAGYNVILIDGDDGSHIINNLSEEALQRLFVVDVTPNFQTPIMAEFITRLCKGEEIVWDEQAKKVVHARSQANIEHSHFILNGRELDRNTVLVIDSWKALAFAVGWRFAIEQNIDLSDASKIEWEGYRYQGMLLTWYLEQLHSFNCHIIVIGHTDYYEKRKADGKTIDWVRTQIKSSSGPHATQVGSHFSDILYFTKVGAGAKSFKINTEGTNDREGGSRNIEPGIFLWEDLQFSHLIQAAHGPAPLNRIISECPGLSIFNKGQELPSKATKLNAKTDTPAVEKAPALTGGKAKTSFSLGNKAK